MALQITPSGTAMSLLRKRFQTIRELESLKDTTRLRFRPRREDQKRTREAFVRTVTAIGNESMETYLVKEASVQTLPTSDEVFENWEGWTERSGTPMDPDRPESPPPPLVSNLDRIMIEVQATANDEEDDDFSTGSSMLNPRVAAVTAATANSSLSQDILEPTHILVDFPSFDKYLFEDSEPFPDITLEQAQRMSRSADFINLCDRYEEVASATTLAAPVNDAICNILALIAQSTDPYAARYHAGGALIFSNSPSSMIPELGDGGKLPSSTFAVHRGAGVSPRQLFLCWTSPTSYQPPTSILSSKRKRGEDDVGYDEIEHHSKRSRSEGSTDAPATSTSPYESPSSLPRPTGLQSFSEPMVIDSCEPPAIEVSDPADIILEQHPHRRHIIAVLFNHSTLSFSYLDQAGSITSTPISIRDPRFVASIMRLIAGGRALAGYETWLAPAIPDSNRDSQGMIPAGSQITLGRTQYTISRVVDALEYDSAIYTNLFVAHPTGPGPTYPISKLLIKFSYQSSDLTREDITLRHLANNTHEDWIIRVCGAFVPVRLSDPHNFRGKILPGGANRLYRDLELRALILGVVEPSGPIPSGALSLDAVKEVLPGLEHVIMEHLPVEVVEDDG